MQKLKDFTVGAFIIRRLQSDQKISASGEKFDTKYIWQSLKDWKTWAASESLLDHVSSVPHLVLVCMYAGL